MAATKEQATIKIDREVLEQNHNATIKIYKLASELQRQLKAQNERVIAVDKILRAFENKNVINENDESKKFCFISLDHEGKQYCWLDSFTITAIAPLLGSIGGKDYEPPKRVQQKARTSSLPSIFSEGAQNCSTQVVTATLRAIQDEIKKIKDDYTPHNSSAENSTFDIKKVEQHTAAETDKKSALQRTPGLHDVEVDKAPPPPSSSVKRSFESMVTFFNDGSDSASSVELTNKIHHSEMRQLFSDALITNTLWRHLRNFFLVGSTKTKEENTIINALKQLQIAILDRSFAKGDMKTANGTRHLWLQEKHIALVSKQLTVLKDAVTHYPRNSHTFQLPLEYRNDSNFYLECFSAVITYLENLLNLQRPENRRQDDDEEKRKYVEILYGAVTSNSIAWENCGCKYIQNIFKLCMDVAARPGQGRETALELVVSPWQFTSGSPQR